MAADQSVGIAMALQAAAKLAVQRRGMGQAVAILAARDGRMPAFMTGDTVDSAMIGVGRGQVAALL